MTVKDAFSAVEWAVLTELPVRVVASAITADPITTGLGSIIEEVTGITQLSQGASQRAHSELVQAVFAEYKENGEGEAKTMELSQQWVETLIPETYVRARQVADILASRVSAEEASAFTSWLLETAEAVCAAAKSGGGILGIGGKRISDAESDFLDNLSKAFDPNSESGD